MKLQAKILLILVPLIVVPLVLHSWIAYSKLRETTEQIALEHMAALTRQWDLQINSQLQAIQANLELFSRSQDLQSYLGTLDEAERARLLRPALTRLFASYQQSYPDYYEISVVSAQGMKEITSKRPDLARRKEVDRTYLERMIATGRDNFSTYLLDAANSQVSLMVSKRLQLPTEDPASVSRNLGYLVITVDLNLISQEIKNCRIGHHGFVFLTDSQGKILFHPDQKLLGKQLAASLFQTLLKAIATEKTIKTEVGKRAFFFQGRHVHEDLLLFAALPQTEILVKGRTVGILTIVITVLAILIFTTLAFFVLRYALVNPVQKLSLAAQEFGKGNLLVPIEVNTADELGELAHSLKEMGRNLRQSNKQIQYFAYHDSLTKLPNRLMFSEYLAHALAHAKRHQQSLALLFLDLDDFKRINDTLGHQSGDQVLREFARRLSSCLRADDYVGRAGAISSKSDTVARLGGDEFTILLPNIKGTYQAAAVAKRVLEAISKPFLLENQEFHVSTSIGITIYPNDGTDAETLIKNADMAMYHAKARGKNTYRYYRESMNAAAIKRLTLENALRKAVEREEFLLHYQPQVDLATGRIVAVEALIRWQHPKAGIMYPSKFIPLAEETGLIVPIGEWVINTACQQNQRWHEAGFDDLTVSVNISVAQFNRQNIKRIVTEALDNSGLPPEFLEIELTESTLMRTENVVTDALTMIKKLGVRIAMDDFGTGYSSLSYLRKLPIDKLKVDRSFICNITTNKEDAAIISAIIAMAHSLNLAVTAEGVGTQAQVEFLRQQGCRFIQGHIISPAVPANVITNLLTPRAVSAA